MIFDIPCKKMYIFIIINVYETIYVKCFLC